MTPSVPQGAITGATAAALTALLSQSLYGQGQRFYVAPGTGPGQGSDSYDGLSPLTPFRTLGKALQTAVAGRNDVVYLLSQGNVAAQTTDYQSVTLDWNKNNVHLIGVNCAPFLGQRSRVALLSTYDTASNLFTVSANGCLIQNVEFFAGVAGTTPTGCMKVTGDRNHFINCQISGVGNSANDILGAYDLTVTGSENIWDGCYIGLDTVLRATCVTGVVFSGSPTRNMFRNCEFDWYTSASTFKGITVPTTADRWIKFNDCNFSCATNITSATAPTGIIGITTMNGYVRLKNPGLFGITQIVTADNAYVQVLGLNGLATGHLIGIAQGVDAS